MGVGVCVYIHPFTYGVYAASVRSLARRKPKKRLREYARRKKGSLSGDLRRETNPTISEPVHETDNNTNGR